MHKTDSWFVCVTNTGCERRATQGLVDAGFEVWWPTRTVEVRIGRGRAKVDRVFPLFPGYLFVGMGRARDWQQVLGVDGIKAVLCNDWRPLMLPWSTVEKLRADTADLAVPIIEDAYVIGEQIRIVSGAFASWNAVVQRMIGTDAVEIDVAMFGRGNRIKVGIEQVERV